MTSAWYRQQMMDSSSSEDESLGASDDAESPVRKLRGASRSPFQAKQNALELPLKNKPPSRPRAAHFEQDTENHDPNQRQARPSKAEVVKLTAKEAECGNAGGSALAASPDDLGDDSSRVGVLLGVRRVALQPLVEGPKGLAAVSVEQDVRAADKEQHDSAADIYSRYMQPVQARPMRDADADNEAGDPTSTAGEYANAGLLGGHCRAEGCLGEDASSSTAFSIGHTGGGGGNGGVRVSAGGGGSGGSGSGRGYGGNQAGMHSGGGSDGGSGGAGGDDGGNGGGGGNYVQPHRDMQVVRRPSAQEATEEEIVVVGAPEERATWSNVATAVSPISQVGCSRDRDLPLTFQKRQVFSMGPSKGGRLNMEAGLTDVGDETGWVLVGLTLGMQAVVNVDGRLGTSPRPPIVTALLSRGKRAIPMLGLDSSESESSSGDEADTPLSRHSRMPGPRSPVPKDCQQDSASVPVPANLQQGASHSPARKNCHRDASSSASPSDHPQNSNRTLAVVDRQNSTPSAAEAGFPEGTGSAGKRASPPLVEVLTAECRSRQAVTQLRSMMEESSESEDEDEVGTPLRASPFVRVERQVATTSREAHRADEGSPSRGSPGQRLGGEAHRLGGREEDRRQLADGDEDLHRRAGAAWREELGQISSPRMLDAEAAGMREHLEMRRASLPEHVAHSELLSPGCTPLPRDDMPWGDAPGPGMY
eukprot:gene22047-26560_t